MPGIKRADWPKAEWPLSVAMAQKLPFHSAGKNGGAL
jgi:hypothetical protein